MYASGSSCAPGITCTRITQYQVLLNIHVHGYHQKYFLWGQHKIHKELQLSDQELLNSNIAAHLNGYFGGYRSLSDFERDLSSFNIFLDAQEKYTLIVNDPGNDED